MNDVGLFDHRSGDYATSIMAAIKNRKARGHQRALVLAAYCLADHPMTDEQALLSAGLHWRNAAWKRCTELRHHDIIGWVEDKISENSSGAVAGVCAVLEPYRTTLRDSHRPDDLAAMIISTAKGRAMPPRTSVLERLGGLWARASEVERNEFKIRTRLIDINERTSWQR